MILPKILVMKRPPKPEKEQKWAKNALVSAVEVHQWVWFYKRKYGERMFTCL
jgi:hypothetical protein